MIKKPIQNNDEDYRGQNHLHTMIAELGYLRGVVEGIDEKVTNQNHDIVRVKEKMAGYDIWFGKFGAGMALLAVGFSFAINFLVQWVQHFFTKGG